MGRRGPRAEPTHIRLLRGNPGHRAINREEPKPELVDTIAPPKILLDDPVAMEKWNETVAHLSSLQMLADVQSDLLTLYCVKWSEWQFATKKRREFGEVVKAPSGYAMTSPYVSIANKAWSDCLRAQAELGITPAAMGKVKTTTKKSKLDTFIDRRARRENA